MAETRVPSEEMVSAVVVTYNSAACVGVCLRSVRDAFADAELIVVDNGSCDSTVAAVRSAAPDARLIEMGENIGFGRACNVGAQAARASHLLFLNPDAAVAGVQREELEHVLRTRPFGLVAPALDSDRDRIRGEASWV